MNERKTEMLHYRPEKDDVAVYSPDLDEIRIHAGTKGERELYRKQLGQRLFGDDDYFSQKKACTLEPLRANGMDALDVEGVGGDLERVVLREYEVAYDSGFEEVMIRKATDVFAAAEAAPPQCMPAQAPSCVFSALSTTRATSTMRIGAPFL